MPVKTQSVIIHLLPTRARVEAPSGAPLRDLLFEQGVEFPCGGQGRCRGCRVRVVTGDLAVNGAQRERLTPAEISQGWRLACQCRAEADVTLELRQWDAAILGNDETFAFTPREGLGIVADLGTTTIVAQLLDLSTAQVLAVRSSLNPQARFGGDVMSRIEAAVFEGMVAELSRAVRKEIGRLARLLLDAAGRKGREVRSVLLAGNTAMHHLFSGCSAEPLSRMPFEPAEDGLQAFSGGDLGWETMPGAAVRFLPCLGGFVGSDILAGVLATGLHERHTLGALIDLGTNGEMVLGTREGLLCASAAAGPAFEGARISCGMRASSGAISRARAAEGRVECEVLGNGPATGVCGSGLLDIVAAALDTGLVLPSGRIADGSNKLPLRDGLFLTQGDIRQLQLAKGAIAAGIRILLTHLGAEPSDVREVFLAGAFGNYVDRRSAVRTGLLPFLDERIQAAGNTSLLGAKMALFAGDDESLRFQEIRDRIRHVPLNEDPAFQDLYVEAMGFPA